MSDQPILSAQLYSLRSLPTFDDQLDAVREAGYRYVELQWAQLADPTATRQKLQARGLKASSAHAPLPMLRGSYQQVLDAARTLNLPHLFVPAHPSNERDGGPQDRKSVV